MASFRFNAGAVRKRASRSRFVAGLLKTVAVLGGVLGGLVVALSVSICLFIVPLTLIGSAIGGQHETTSVIGLIGALFAILAGTTWGGLRVGRQYRMNDPHVEGKQAVVSSSTPNQAVACPNCGAERRERFCGVCGQNDRDYRRLSTTLANVIGEIFEADSRLWRSLHALFFRPGFLALEFAQGRRAHYVSPFRFYLFASLIYFLAATLLIGDPSSAPTSVGSNVSDDTSSQNVFSDPQINNLYLEYLPLAVIFALPLYAMMLQLLFIGRRVYAESFVFVLHLQTIGFFILLPFELWLLYTGADPWQYFGFTLPLGVYLFLALKRFYCASVLRTLAGWAAALSIYVFFMFVVVLGTVMVVALSMGNDLSSIFVESN